jgi:hypothetical protein
MTPETHATQIDDLLDAFQRVCEDVTVAYERGSAGRAKYEKERAILRNDLRARLLSGCFDVRCIGCGQIGTWRADPDAASLSSTPTRAATDAEALAQRFHEAYERLAPQYGYETREGSSVPWEHVPIANRDLMIATCAEVLRATDLCERCHMPATGSGLAFSDGTICNEPRHAGSVPSSTTATPLSEQELATIAVVRGDVARGLTTYAAQSRILLGILDRLTGAPK